MPANNIAKIKAAGYMPQLEQIRAQFFRADAPAGLADETWGKLLRVLNDHSIGSQAFVRIVVGSHRAGVTASGLYKGLRDFIEEIETKGVVLEESRPGITSDPVEAFVSSKPVAAVPSTAMPPPATVDPPLLVESDPEPVPEQEPEQEPEVHVTSVNQSGGDQEDEQIPEVDPVAQTVGAEMAEGINKIDEAVLTETPAERTADAPPETSKKKEPAEPPVMRAPKKKDSVERLAVRTELIMPTAGINFVPSRKRTLTPSRPQFDPLSPHRETIEELTGRRGHWSKIAKFLETGRQSVDGIGDFVVETLGGRFDKMNLMLDMLNRGDWGPAGWVLEVGEEQDWALLRRLSDIDMEAYCGEFWNPQAPRSSNKKK